MTKRTPSQELCTICANRNRMIEVDGRRVRCGGLTEHRCPGFRPEHREE